MSIETEFWTADRTMDSRHPSGLDSFREADVFFDILLATGYVWQAQIPRVDLTLVGPTPKVEVMRRVFEAEFVGDLR